MFLPIWPSSGVKMFCWGNCCFGCCCCYISPRMRMYVCNTCEISLEFCVCAVFMCRVVTYLCTHCEAFKKGHAAK
jgi:hypothetical protein